MVYPIYTQTGSCFGVLPGVGSSDMQTYDAGKLVGVFSGFKRQSVGGYQYYQCLGIYSENFRP